MGFTPTEKIWFNGKLVPWQDAKVHVLAHGLHYGTGVFEGMRSYQTADGAAVFRLDTHLKRFFESAAVYDLTIPYSPQQLADATRELVMQDIANKADIAAVKAEIGALEQRIYAAMDTLALRLTVRMGVMLAAGLSLVVALIGLLVRLR